MAHGLQRRLRVPFDGVKVFSATMFTQRETLGEQVTAWMQRRPGLQISDIVVAQSSDHEFHCVTIVVFYLERPTA